MVSEYCQNLLTVSVTIYFAVPKNCFICPSYLLNNVQLYYRRMVFLMLNGVKYQPKIRMEALNSSWTKS